jgi:hypothetical protein
MWFLRDNTRKILFGWSAKSGCSHFKKLAKFLIFGDLNCDIHTEEEYCELPPNYEDYHIIICIRNPYERLVSGFLDKYSCNEKGIYVSQWNNHTNNRPLTFRNFVDELTSTSTLASTLVSQFQNHKYEDISKDDTCVIKYDSDNARKVKSSNATVEVVEFRSLAIDKHHFTQALTEGWNDKIKDMDKNKLYIYDINTIDYEAIENLYNVSDNHEHHHEHDKYNENENENKSKNNRKIPIELINFRGGHEGIPLHNRIHYENAADELVSNFQIHESSSTNMSKDFKSSKSKSKRKRSITKFRPLTKDFYLDENIKKKVDDFYAVDFQYFNEGLKFNFNI